MADELDTVIETPAKETPVTTSTVRNPEKLLEQFNEQKVELKELRALKVARDQEISAAEQKRLEDKGQYEALIPKKIEEAVTPLQKQIEKLTKERDELTVGLSTAKSQFENLQTEIKTEKVKDATYREFLAQDGSSKTSKDVFWKLYGDQVAVDDKGSPVKLDELFTTIKADDFGASLFTVKVPEGSGTPKQSGTPGKAKAPGPIVISKSEANNAGFLRKNGITLEQIGKGEVVIEG